VPVSAQLAPVGIPAGTVRVELDGSLETFDRRFRNGLRESFAADFSSPALGSAQIPLLVDADQRVARIIGNPGYRLNLGALTTEAMADVGTGSLGLGLGLTNGITIFGRIPLVRTRVQNSMRLNSTDADAGFNPGVAGQVPFFQNFDAAIATLSGKLAAGDYNADPATRALAEATLTEATTLRADLFGLLGDPVIASAIVPTTSSAAGGAVLARVTSLQTTMASNLQVPGFTLAPGLAEAPLGDDQLRQILTAGLGLRIDEARVTFRGDAEVGAAITLIDSWDRGTRRGGFRAAISGLVRLPTGLLERSDRPLDIGTGEGQTDIQVDLTTDVGAGAFGARLAGSYVRQLSADFQTRVAPPGLIVGPDRLSFVRRDPGDIIAINVQPFFRLARTFALQAGVQHWSRKVDQVSYRSPADALPGVDPGVLATETAANATVFSAGFTYSNPGRLRAGGTGLPVDASWMYERVIRSGSGIVPNAHRVRARFRMYFGLW
jgi:hypothetical protein